MGSVTSDDAKISGAKPVKEQASASTALGNPPEPAIRPRNANRTGRVHDMVDGVYRSNRTGYQLCTEFNSGSCTNTIQGSWCGVHNSLAHQCSRCLGTHSLQSCPRKESPKVGWLQGDRPKKGKGKGKEKGAVDVPPTDRRLMTRFHIRTVHHQLELRVQLRRTKRVLKRCYPLNQFHVLVFSHNRLNQEAEFIRARRCYIYTLGLTEQTRLPSTSETWATIAWR